MARKHSKGGTWVARRLNEQKRYREAVLGMADDFQDADNVAVFNFTQAQEAARKWFHAEVRKDHGLDDVRQGKYTVADAMHDYLEHYTVEGKSVSSTRNNIDAHILPTLGTIELSRLTTKKIADWHHAIAVSEPMLRTRSTAETRRTRPLGDDPDAKRSRRASANRILTVLKAALNYAWKEGKVTSDTAWRKVKPFRNVDAPVIRYLTEAECVRLVNVCSPDFRKMVKAALLTGCRYGELCALKVKDFNPDTGTVAVRTTKSGKPRHVVLADEGKIFFVSSTLGKHSEGIIFTHEGGHAWGKSHQSRMMTDACKNAQIEPAVSFHVLRHTHGSLLAMQGVPMPVIAKQLGHADTRMTEKHYAHLSPNYVADTIRQHFPTLGLTEPSNIVSLKPKKQKRTK